MITGPNADPRPDHEARNKIFSGLKVPELNDFLIQSASYGKVTESRRELFRNRVNQISSKYFKNHPGRVLDIGASSGVFMEEATTIGWDAYGVEPSAEGTAALVQKGLKAKQAFAEQLPYPDNYFDWVHSNHVFEHLADPLAAAKEAFRVLKPGGFIFIEVPNQFDNIQFFRYRLINNIPVRERNIRSIHHLFFFSKMTLRSLMKTSGFRHIQVLDYYGNKRTGLAALGSTIVRAIGKLYLGGPFIQVIARK
jgi:ubiquinone/menaquinone biosynthesis C-methylase UbiE